MEVLLKGTYLLFTSSFSATSIDQFAVSLVACRPHLLHVVVQGDDVQRRRQAAVARYGGAHRRRLADVAMVTGLQEVGCLVVFVQHFDLEVGERWQGVSIVLLCLQGGRE